MNLKHLIVTEDGFEAPNWRQGLDPVRLVAYTGGEPPAVPAQESRVMVWVLAGVPDWERLVSDYSGHCPVVVLSRLARLPEMQRALEAGARGYIEVLANPVQLQQAAATVSQGALWIAAPMLSRLLGILSSALPEREVPAVWQEKLSRRELQVAEAVATGISNKAVAAQLHITVRTVKEHLTSIFAKLGIQDRLQLILMAREGKRTKL